MNELTTQPSFSLEPRNLAEAMEYAKIIASSDMVPKDYINKPGNVLVAVQTGAELGLKPMQSLQGIAVINGRPTIWGDAQWALIVGHPEFEYSKDDLSDTKATVWLKRRNQPEIVRSFSMEDAKKAGLSGKSGPWTTNPKRMMHMRARAFASRDLFPDALKGIKSTEEVRDYGTDPEKDMGAAEVVSTPTPTLPPYPVERFEKNKSNWKVEIQAGRGTPEELIAALGTKGILTEAQRDEILAMAKLAEPDDFDKALDASGQYAPQ
jgi:hypothetical protein